MPTVTVDESPLGAQQGRSPARERLVGNSSCGRLRTMRMALVVPGSWLLLAATLLGCQRDGASAGDLGVPALDQSVSGEPGDAALRDLASATRDMASSRDLACGVPPVDLAGFPQPGCDSQCPNCGCNEACFFTAYTGAVCRQRCATTSDCPIGMFCGDFHVEFGGNLSARVCLGSGDPPICNQRGGCDYMCPTCIDNSTLSRPRNWEYGTCGHEYLHCLRGCVPDGGISPIGECGDHCR
jgi:hypothetical protein